MARTPDKPGTWRVRATRDGSRILSGVTSSGKRVRVPVASDLEGEQLARSLFPGMATSSTPTIPKIIDVPSTSFKVDDWGIPVVTEESAASVASAMGLPPVVPAVPNPTVAETDAKVKEAAAKKVELQETRKKTAKSLTTLLGHGYAMGVVMVSQKVVTSAGKVPVKPAPKQVADLAEVTKDTITEWFGDHEVQPWIMMVLLSVGIPLSMYIQSPKAPRLTQEQIDAQTEEAQSQGLRSVT